MAECACVHAVDHEPLGGRVPDTVRKVFVYLVAGFLIFYLITQPVAFAAVVRSLGSAIGEAFDALMRFFEALTP